MLTHLSIQNIALIEGLHLDFSAHFTALTGETGAGKSLLLDSLGLALGARADAGLIRHGQNQAEVTACFVPAASPALTEMLDEQGLALDDGQLILRRQLKREGATATSKAWVNGVPVAASVLAQVGGLCVDIHGQNGQHALMQPTAQRDVFDAMAGHTALGEETRRTYLVLRAEQARQTELEQRVAEAEHVAEELTRLRQELEKLAYVEGEEEALAAQRHRLLHAAQLSADLEMADSALSTPEGAVTALRTAARAVHAASMVDETLKPLANRLEALHIDLSDAAHDVARASSQIEAEGNLETVDDRLHALKIAARKAKCDIPQLAEKMAEIRAQTIGKGELEGLLIDQKRATAAAHAAFSAACEALSHAREKARTALETAIQAALRDLILPHAVFQVALDRLPESQWGPYGAQTVTFLLAANPGSPAQPIAKVASGGELSRLMLALKSVLYQGLPAQTVIFDEIDTGLSGAAASAVGRAMARLGASHQTLAITHHPQVAACATHQLRISKQVQAGNTTTHIQVLSAEERADEIARLLSGASTTAQAHAAAVALLAEAQKPAA